MEVPITKKQKSRIISLARKQGVEKVDEMKWRVIGMTKSTAQQTINFMQSWKKK